MSKYTRYVFCFLAGVFVTIFVTVIFYLSRDFGLTIKEHAYLGIAIFSIALLIGLLIAILTFWSFQDRIYPKGYKKISVSGFLRVEADGKHRYEFYKHIEAKKPFLFQYNHAFYRRNGSDDPEIRTEHQRVLNIQTDPKQPNKKIVWFAFPRALLYNHSTVVSFEMIFENYKNDIGPFLEFVIDSPIEYIKWHIEFAQGYDKIDRKPARVLIKEEPYDFQPIKGREPIKFDQSTRSYREKILHPTVGTTYRLEWGVTGSSIR